MRTYINAAEMNLDQRLGILKRENTERTASYIKYLSIQAQIING